MLKVSQVCKAIKSQPILKDVSFRLADASIIGLAGPSGGGKSTLLRCIQGLEVSDSGRIECDVQTGFMFQDFQLFPHMTVLKNLVYAPQLKDRRQDHTAYARELLTRLGVAEKEAAYPHQLSGGQKQRVALARSLMMRPGLLLCDEPTSGLDIATISDVVVLLKSVNEMGIAMIIASHDLDFLTQISDKIILLRQGKIVISVEPSAREDVVSYLKSSYG